MAYRFTNTEKWSDSWFSDLSQIEKLLFIYLCDNCDIAGFIEINLKRWIADLSSSKETIEGALKGLQRGLIFSKSNDCIFIRNFLKHQKNLPLNENNKAHLGIIRRFDLYFEKFDLDSISDFTQAHSKGLQSPSGIGISIGIDKSNKSLEEKNWRNDFEIYKSDLRKVYQELTSDSEFILNQEKYHPGIDIVLSIEKACVNFWSTEAGWKHKKKSKSKDIDWKTTLINAIDLNKVYKQTKKDAVNEKGETYFQMLDRVAKGG